ncbi:arsenic transporter [Aurantimonas sp. Leaf443]|uniref:arsenic transporter n=1 Tax=Aurantimonas sp. Leaf443 TaxID=1736378 RepID=UPI0006F52FF7|nr:arsenic transporter [Aurantimonas sp. Leaf443]KQT86332.1 arsenic transporter [Aurantimonas sp. Leaf443]
MFATAQLLTWGVSFAAVAGVITRPFGWSEWVFAVAGVALLVGLGLIGTGDVLAGVAAGTDVYLFLAGMMMLAEVARREGLFDWLAARAARAAAGSAQRLFLLVYAVGTLVTVFLSNDATAVVLTPAVAAVARAAKAPSAIPYLLVCAFVANAASFVLPISNPANLVIFGEELPPLAEWLSRFALPSLVAIVATYAVLRWTQGADLRGETARDIPIPVLSRGGRLAALGICIGAAILLVASWTGAELGLPTLLCGLATLLAVLVAERSDPRAVLKGISWDTLVLVAGLFVIVRALEKAGVSTVLAGLLRSLVAEGTELAAAVSGIALAFGTNVTNNLPLGLLAGATMAAVDVPEKVTDAILIGIDLGPNLSVTGSLATILWLTALRREGLDFGAWRFLKLGVLVMPPALLLALAALLLQPWT